MEEQPKLVPLAAEAAALQDASKPVQTTAQQSTSRDASTSRTATEVGEEAEKGMPGPAEQTAVKESDKRIRKWTIFDPFHYGPPPPPPKSLDDAETIRLAGASWLSQTTFWWLQPLLVLGYKRELTQTDLPKMDPSRESGHLADEFERNFDKRRKAVEEWNAKLESGEYRPSVLDRAKWKMLGRKDGKREVGIGPALSDTFFWEFWSAGIYKIVGDLAQTTSPLVTRRIIQEVQTAYAAHRAGQPLPSIGSGVGLSFALLFMQIIYSVCTNNTFSRSGQVGILARGALIAAAYRKALKLNGKARTKISNAKLTSLISTSISRIDFASSFFHFSYTCIIQLVEIIVILLVSIGVSSLAGVALVFLSLPLQTWALKRLFTGRQATQVHTDARISAISEMLSGIRVVKPFAWEGPLLERVATSRRKEIGGLRKLLTIRAATQSLAFTIPVLASVVVFAVYSATGHQQDPAAIWTSLSLLNLLRFPLMLLPSSLSTSTDAYSAMKDLTPLFLGEELPAEPFTVDEKAEYAIKVENANFAWETAAESRGGTGKKEKKEKKEKVEKKERVEEGKTVEEEEKPSELVDINLEVQKGELLCVVGSVGSGKSSLLQGLVGEMRRTSGSVTFASDSIAYSQQSAWITNATLRENILFGQPFDETRYWDCVRAACLLDDFDQLPSGDLTEIGEKGIALSGGQRQRVSIARVLYSDKDIILLDDPLSAVDAHVGAHIFKEAIRGTLQHKTVILATHALAYLPQATSVLVLENGKIVERGTYEELVAAKSNFSRFMLEHGVTSAVDGKAEQKKVAVAGVGGEKKAGGGASKPLMTKEEQASGGIGLSTWAGYAAAARGWITVPLVALSIVAMAASQVLSNFALVWWQAGTFGLNEKSFIGLYAGLGISTAVFTFTMGLAVSFFGTAAARALHDKALAAVIRAPISYFDTSPLGRIMNRFAKDIDSVDNRLNDSLRMCLATVAQIAAAIIMLAVVYPYFLIPVAVVVFAFYRTSAFYRKTSTTFKRHDNVLRSSLYAFFGESLTGLSTIRAFRAQERHLEQNEAFLDLENRAYFITICNQRWLGIRLEFMGSLLTFVVAIVAVVERTRISSSKTGLVLATVLGMSQAMTMLVRQQAEVENNMASTQRLLHFAQNTPKEAAAFIDSTAPPADWPRYGSITLRNIELRYRPEIPPVLHDVSLEIKGGEKVGVVGRTGAGKSTLLQALFRIIELSKGQIEIDGVDVGTIGLAQLRQRLAIIPQEPLLFNGTIRSNLDPFSLHTDHELNDALRRSWLIGRETAADGSGQASRFSLDSKVDDEGANMSVGERSLVSLARALVKDSRIVCLDEATASVDLETDAKIQQTIRDEFKDKTLLTIAHRVLTILSYDRILVLDAGRVDSFATPLELYDIEGGIFRSLCDQSGISRQDIVVAQEKK